MHRSGALGRTSGTLARVIASTDRPTDRLIAKRQLHSAPAAVGVSLGQQALLLTPRVRYDSEKRRSLLLAGCQSVRALIA